MRHCPNCNQPVESTAIVNAFNDPPNWSFWGQPGARWIVCQTAGLIHFRIITNGRTLHRLATIVPDAPIPQPPHPADAPAEALINVVTRTETQGEDWL